jgi:hypothetical protein
LLCFFASVSLGDPVEKAIRQKKEKVKPMGKLVSIRMPPGSTMPVVESTKPVVKQKFSTKPMGYISFVAPGVSPWAVLCLKRCPLKTPSFA